MVQEFHVLRCCGCETFQVQQVKKAKKWNCKMCGEKQSVIKEYGRGTGADCRRHVQKLNSLRGELLEEENENAWSRWEEDEECEYNQEDKGLPSEPHQGDGESRWSKYVETAAAVDDDDEEEGNIYTESKRFGRQSNIRKRKKGRGAKRGFGCRGDDDDEEEDQVEVAGPWKRDKGHKQAPAHLRSVNSSAAWEDNGFSTPSFHPNTPTPFAASKPLPSGVPSRNVPGNHHGTSLSTEPNASRPTGLVATQRPLGNNREADSFAPRPVTKVSQPENKSSKWARFITSPDLAQEDQEESAHDGDSLWSGTDEGSEKVWSVPGCQDSDSATGRKERNNSKTTLEKTSHSSGLFGGVPGRANHCGVADKIKSAAACFGFVSTTNQMASPTFSTRPIGQEMPVCHQPPPAKRPCPGLAVSSLFQTDEDFDYTF
ncbi:MRN complex-interacting protein [Sardina pilchardus]|uniref:MRN complex-interacting protein n=1 Tax=Sardina pilchardus TaxID=27697 RepID=UPI002E16269E